MAPAFLVKGNGVYDCVDIRISVLRIFAVKWDTILRHVGQTFPTTVKQNILLIDLALM